MPLGDVGCGLADDFTVFVDAVTGVQILQGDFVPLRDGLGGRHACLSTQPGYHITRTGRGGAGDNIILFCEFYCLDFHSVFSFA